jgi:hypothetical protein
MVLHRPHGSVERQEDNADSCVVADPVARRSDDSTGWPSGGYSNRVPPPHPRRRAGRKLKKRTRFKRAATRLRLIRGGSGTRPETRLMSTPISIVIAGILIAFAILITGHWQISVAGPGRTHRLARWTGANRRLPLRRAVRDTLD